MFGITNPELYEKIVRMKFKTPDEKLHGDNLSLGSILVVLKEVVTFCHGLNECVFIR